MTPTFKANDILVVSPEDHDDSEALAHAGQRCQFVRYADAAVGARYAVVKFSTKGRHVYLRPSDLAPAPVSIEVAS
jgi:hypothetical protein